MLPLYMSMILASAAGCHAVEGETVTLADLSSVLGELPSRFATLRLGYSPQVGTRRIFRQAEIAAALARVDAEVYKGPDVCVERASIVLTPEMLLPVLAAVWRSERVRVELVDFPKGAVPQGRLEFSRNSLAEEANTRVWRWHGKMVYGRNRSVQLTVRVRLHAERQHFYAVRFIESGHVIDAEDFRTETTDDPLSRLDKALGASIAGMSARSDIPAGAEILTAQLSRTVEVRRGDRVIVHSEMGGVHLKLSAEAATSGVRGQKILLRSSLSRKLLAAFVCGPGVVSVRAGGDRRCEEPLPAASRGYQHE